MSTEVTPKGRLMRDWLITQWSERLCGILESMADERPSIEQKEVSQGDAKPPEDCLVWRQSFANSPDPAIWVATPQSTVFDLGRRTLAAAGVDESDDSDASNTFLEILAQSLSALGESIGSHLACEASATEGVHLPDVPSDLEWSRVQIAFSNATLDPCWLSCAPATLERLAAGKRSDRERPAAEAANAPENAADSNLAAQPASKTFDLLLDVGLPISVSFGRTFLPIKEVLKLTTGSIVELDRGVSEPVDVIVNNCVIARGEVVVVEGNYGVRIQQIASRYDRLRTSSASVQAQHVLAEH